MTDRERLLDELRPVSFAIAYRMLGSVSEAEDVVQEALLRVHEAFFRRIQKRSKGPAFAGGFRLPPHHPRESAIR
jgi:DNA-directed RNA polymerase specialized sigma24 family protein